MKWVELLDRIGERRLERYRIQPPRPWDVKIMVAVLFFAGYYWLVFSLMRSRGIPSEIAQLIRDAMLVLGPVVGAIGQAIFRTDIKDEVTTQNTGEAFRSTRAQAEATKAAIEATPAPLSTRRGVEP